MEPVDRKPFFKPPRQSEKIRRRQKRVTREASEKQNKDVVRSRDNKRRGGCSFPLCGCKKFRLAKHVAHLDHKGMGGNQAEDRSTPDKMIQVCIARHREHAFAIDRGTVLCEPRGAAGTNGPVTWLIDVDTLERLGDFPDVVAAARVAKLDAIAVAMEQALGLETIIYQRAILEWLAEMQV